MTASSDTWPTTRQDDHRRWTPVTYDDLRHDADEADIRARMPRRRPVGWYAWQIDRLKADAKAIRCTRGVTS